MVAAFAQHVLEGAGWLVLGGAGVVAMWLGVGLFVAFGSAALEERAERAEVKVKVRSRSADRQQGGPR